MNKYIAPRPLSTRFTLPSYYQFRLGIYHDEIMLDRATFLEHDQITTTTSIG